MTPKKPLEEFEYPQELIKKVKFVVDALENNDVKGARNRLAELTVNLLRLVDSRKISPRFADDHFTLLSIYIGDNFSHIELGNDINELIFEGMHLHDLGKEYGADISKMNEIAKKYIL